MNVQILMTGEIARLLFFGPSFPLSYTMMSQNRVLYILIKQPGIPGRRLRSRLYNGPQTSADRPV